MMMGEPDVLAERCGSAEPVQLLALAPNESAEPVSSWFVPFRSTLELQRYGDRWLFIVQTYDRELTHAAIDDLEEAPNVVSSRIVSVDGCGGDARVIAEGEYGIHSMRPPTGGEPW